MYDYDVIISFITAFALTYFVTPSIIRVAIKKKLFDIPDERRSHEVVTPRLGGIAIFTGIIFSTIIWVPFNEYGNNFQFVIVAIIVIVLTGVKDDIDAISPSTKLGAELFAAFILFFKADIRISGFHGIMGVENISMFWSAALTIFTIIVIINAFNLIDGINGLSGSTAVIATSTLGIWFLLVKRYDLAILAISTAGATVAFLKYNFSPAKIFMGDTGALLLGLICSILTIHFIELNEVLEISHPFRVNAAPSVAIGILILPLFDTLRVFLTRALRGRNPLQPDRTHIHHLLIDSGLTHMQATGVLAGVSIFFIILVFLLQRYINNSLFIILLVVGIASLLMAGLYHSVRKRLKITL